MTGLLLVDCNLDDEMCSGDDELLSLWLVQEEPDWEHSLVICEDAFMLLGSSIPGGTARVFIVSFAGESDVEPPGNSWVS